MKIKTKVMDYDKVMKLPRPSHKKPIRPSRLLQLVIRIASLPTVWKTKFTYDKHGMDKLDPKEPILILMNHSSFTDMKIANAIFFPKRYGIITTSDAFVGMEWLMRWVGCVPTQKFVNDVTLIRDMEYLLKEKKTSILMYPEASYSFDGRATPLPRKLGVLLKKLNVPVVTVITSGAFSREPLYNCLQKRPRVPVTAHVRCLLTPEEIREKSVAELDAMLDEAFTFDGFAWQRDNHMEIDVPYRADGLNRILYRCAACGTEGEMEGKGTTLTCHHCGKVWHMDELGHIGSIRGVFQI